MPSKFTFALVALLAATASVSALPNGYGSTEGIQARDLDAGISYEQLITRNDHHHHGHGHRHPHHHHQHHIAQTEDAAPVDAPVPQAGGQSLKRREYYEELVTRNDHHHMHHFGHGAHPHAHHHHHAPHFAPEQDASAPTDGQQLGRREDLERRGFLEAIGLKSYTKELTPIQNERFNKAKKDCEAVVSKKDKKNCEKDLKKMVKLTKERNWLIGEFVKKTGKHDLFPSADPNRKSDSVSSTSSHSQGSFHY